jgi:hypothetical protein
VLVLVFSTPLSLSGPHRSVQWFTRVNGSSILIRPPVSSAGTVREFFVFWTFVEIFFTNNTLAKHFLKIDRTLGAIGHHAELCGSAWCQLMM